MKFKFPKKRKKELILSFLTIFSGGLIGLGMFLQENRESDTHSLPRKGWGEGAYEETLKIHTPQGTEEIQVTVEEQKYTQIQVETFLKEAYYFLSQWFQENTGSEGSIGEDLLFPSEIPENPVQLFWSTNSPDLLSWNGHLGEHISPKGSPVTIRCTLSLGETENVWEQSVLVFPPALSPAEELEKAVQQEAENISSSSEKELLLPSVVQGQEVSYQRLESRDSWLIWILSLLLGLGIFPLSKEREKQTQLKKTQQMQRDYPDIIQKMILYLKAGLSIRMSVEKLAADYMKRKEASLTETRWAYEEIVKTCRELKGGIYEKDAYERLGRRCGLAEYKVLSVLLVQNLKKGNQSILELLEREAVSAGEDRLRRARIQGEEASTKLLLPMILQLIVVLIILMVPAFLNFF